MRLRNEVEKLRQDVDMLKRRVNAMECDHPDTAQVFDQKLTLAGMCYTQACTRCSKRTYYIYESEFISARDECYQRIVNASSSAPAKDAPHA